MRETIVTIDTTTGATGSKFSVNSNRFVSITALVDSSETGTVTFTARTEPRAQFEALIPDDTIDLTAPQTLNIKDTKIIEMNAVSTGVGSSEIKLKVQYFD